MIIEEVKDGVFVLCTKSGTPMIGAEFVSESVSALFRVANWYDGSVSEVRYLCGKVERC